MKKFIIIIFIIIFTLLFYSCILNKYNTKFTNEDYKKYKIKRFTFNKNIIYFSPETDKNIINEILSNYYLTINKFFSQFKVSKNIEDQNIIIFFSSEGFKDIDFFNNYIKEDFNNIENTKKINYVLFKVNEYKTVFNTLDYDILSFYLPCIDVFLISKNYELKVSNNEIKKIYINSLISEYNHFLVYYNLPDDLKEISLM